MEDAEGIFDDILTEIRQLKEMLDSAINNCKKIEEEKIEIPDMEINELLKEVGEIEDTLDFLVRNQILCMDREEDVKRKFRKELYYLLMSLIMELQEFPKGITLFEIMLSDYDVFSCDYILDSLGADYIEEYTQIPDFIKMIVAQDKFLENERNCTKENLLAKIVGVYEKTGEILFSIAKNNDRSNFDGFMKIMQDYIMENSVAIF